MTTTSNPEYFTEPAARGSASTKLYRRWPGSDDKELMCQHGGDHAECIERAEARRHRLNTEGNSRPRKRPDARSGIPVVHIDPALLSGLD